MSDNLKQWERFRAVPETAKKPIAGGKLKGKTDINPMWRLKTLTEEFGAVGVGWNYEIKEQQFVNGANGEIACFVKIALLVKDGDAWRQPVTGVGGSMFIATERGQLVTNDEAIKMALTDAISVACKSMGIGADVYWDKDKTKYTAQDETDYKRELNKMLMRMAKNDKNTAMDLLERYTAFEGKNGTVAGKRDLAKLSDKQLQVTYGKVKKDYNGGA